MGIQLINKNSNLQFTQQMLKGDKGEQGDSAYQVALNNGFKGTEAEWLSSLVGAKGDKGDKGEKGAKGDTGAQGLQGEKGEQGERGLQGIQGVAGKDGANGAKGEKGDKGDKGDTGADGLTPYIKDGLWWIGDTNTGVSVSGAEVDLSAFYTKTEVNELIPDTTDFITEQEAKDLIPDTTDFVTMPDVEAVMPDTSAFITMPDVEAKNYQTQEQVNAAIGAIDIPTVPTNLSAFNNDAGYQTAQQVEALINTALGVIENGTY